MKRDVIKSDTACIEIPELELELSHGSLGGIYTTVCVFSPLSHGASWAMLRCCCRAVARGV